MKSIAILEDNDALRDSIVAYFDLSGSYKVTFSSAIFGDLVTKRLEIVPDYLLLDLHLFDSNIVDRILHIKKLLPDTSIIIITGDKDKSMLLQSLQKGASAFLYKPFKMDELEHILDHIGIHGSYLAPDVVTRFLHLVNDSFEEMYSEKSGAKLTGAEREVFNLLLKDLSSAEIANKMFLPQYKVIRHMKCIYIKNNVKNLQEFKAKFGI